MKLLKREFAALPEVSVRFDQEARAAAEIGHDNVVQIYDFGHRQDGTAYLVMPYETGQSLQEHMRALKADTFRTFGRFSWWLVFKGVMSLPGFRVVVTMRCCQEAQRLSPNIRWLFFTLARMMHRFASFLAGVEFPWNTTLAPWLAL